MNIQNYFKELGVKSQQVLEKSLAQREKFGTAHHLSSCIYEFAQHISDSSDKELIMIVSSQLESATLNAGLGLYRQASSSLRLALEMGLGAIYFSVHKLDLYEWRNGRADIKWSTVIDEDNGVLSPRFCNVFFKECLDDTESYIGKAKITYRSLSEFVHGNSETWNGSQVELSYDGDLLERYFVSYKSVVDVLLFAFCCRYLKSFQDEDLESLQFISEEMNHISYIRNIVGGPKD